MLKPHNLAPSTTPQVSINALTRSQKKGSQIPLTAPHVEKEESQTTPTTPAPVPTSHALTELARETPDTTVQEDAKDEDNIPDLEELLATAYARTLLFRPFLMLYEAVLVASFKRDGRYR
jgi:hypothetical protein